MIYTLILGLILVTFSSIFYIVTSSTLNHELDNELKIKASGIAENIHTYLEVKGEEPKTLQYAVEQTIAREDKTLRRWWFIGFERSWFKKLDEQDLSEDFVNFISLDGGFQVSSKNLKEGLLELFLSNKYLTYKHETFWNLETENKELRIINYPFPNADNPTHIIQVGISKGPITILLKKWMTSVWISIPVILLLTGFIGTVLASRILRPLDRFIQTANKISYENLNLRVEPKLHYREMDSLIRTFNDMLSRLEESFRHIDEFNTQVAHELKTPLTIIRGEAELSYLNAGSKKEKQSLKVIMNEIDSLLTTIEDLLFLGKTRYQPESFNFEEIELNQFLKDVTDQLTFFTSAKHIHLDFHKAKVPVMVRGDKLHLKRLFYNLLDNAIKFTPDGGRIAVSVITKNNKVHVRIKDTGIGISEEHLHRVFDQFFRAESSEKGVGLGLSIALAIAKAHAGEITVQSRPLDGTTFIVTLPYIRIPSLILT